jgi:hypothetical protein
MGDREGRSGSVGREGAARDVTAGAFQLIACHGEFEQRSTGDGVVEGARA